MGGRRRGGMRRDNKGSNVGEKKKGAEQERKGGVTDWAEMET